MEGSHTQEDIQQCIDITYEPWAINGNEELVDVMKQITHVASIGTPALLGNDTFIVPYMASGCPGTADFNCWKMSKAVAILMRSWENKPFPYKRDEEAYQLHFAGIFDGVDNYVEACRRGQFTKLFKFWGMNLKTVLVVEDPLEELEETGYLELDLLGHAIYKPVLPMRNPDETAFDDFYMVTLSRGGDVSSRYLVNDTPDRMSRMVVTNKFRSTKNSYEDALKKQVTEVAKCLSGQLYAWGDPTFGLILAATILRVKTQISHSHGIHDLTD